MTDSSTVPQQALANISLEDTPVKPTDLLYSGRHTSVMFGSTAGMKRSMPTGCVPSSSGLVSNPNSLNRMMCNRAALKTAHDAFVRDYEKRKEMLRVHKQQSRKVAFAEPEDAAVDYGYGDHAEEPSCQEAPAAKRRRFQRRNSKTPAMLMAMASAQLDLGFLKEKDDEDNKPKEKKDEEDSWDGGLEIAEELVKQLQQRRRGNVLP